MSEHTQQKALRLPATINSLTTLGIALRQFLAGLPVTEVWIYPLDLALCEAASNIIRHGYHDDATAHYRVCFSHDGREVTVTLYDSGVPVPEEKRQPPVIDPDAPLTLENLSEGGRGMQLIFSGVDRVSYREGEDENQLTLIKMLP
ncbi:ATP-binding protein [Pantoea piersonii]|uniref:ATP-binding protein n=1 Tax=Pantoea piersonii TaxID=2364647 RepID=UPI00289EBA74|nr:ATP-binding protein [Pantoea piersonii]